MADAILAGLDADKGEDGDEPTVEAAEPVPDPATSSDTAKSNDGSTATAETGKDTEPEDPTDDEIKAFKPDVQKRIKQLLHQRNTARRDAEGSNEAASEYRNIRQFMAENSLADKDMAELFKFGSMVKSNDPANLQQALEMIGPIYRNLQAALGHTVPDDLMGRVDSGELTEDLAKQMAKDRSRAAMAERRATEVTDRATQQQQTQQVQQLRVSIQSAVADWQSQAQQSDPDFGKKAAAMADVATALVAQKGQPKNAQEAVEYAKEAYTRASSYFNAGRPTPKATRPVPDSGANGARQQAQPAANTMLDAVMQGLRTAS